MSLYYPWTNTNEHPNHYTKWTAALVLLYTDQAKLPLGWWSCTVGFSKNWKARRMDGLVLFPYFTTTLRGSEGTLSARYSPVLQVISAPNCSLPRQVHNSAVAGRGGGMGVAQGRCAKEAHMAAPWQLVKSWLCCFSSSLFFHYFSLKCHHGLVWTEYSWSQQQRQMVMKKKIQLLTPS